MGATNYRIAIALGYLYVHWYCESINHQISAKPPFLMALAGASHQRRRAEAFSEERSTKTWASSCKADWIGIMTILETNHWSPSFFPGSNSPDQLVILDVHWRERSHVTYPRPNTLFETMIVLFQRWDMLYSSLEGILGESNLMPKCKLFQFWGIFLKKSALFGLVIWWPLLDGKGIAGGYPLYC